jgi:hypothetical protein
MVRPRPGYFRPYRLFRKAILLLVLVLSAPVVADAQEWTRDELEGARVFIGLSKGNLRAESEGQVRAYIALEKLARELQRRLEGNSLIKAVQLHDLEKSSSARGSDWKIPADRGYTHYLIAVPEVVGIKLVQIRWTIGKLSDSRQLASEMILKGMTYVQIPSTREDLPIVSNTPSIQTIDLSLEEAGRLYGQFQDIFPETKLEPTYAVRCIDDLTDWKAPRARIMAYLSTELSYPPGPIQHWTAARKFTQAEAEKLCKADSQAAEPPQDADLIIGGWLFPVIKDDKHLFQPQLELTYTMGERRKTVANIYKDIDPNKRPRRLSEFCFDEGSTLKTVLDALVQYVQAHREGLNIRGITYAPILTCN